MEKSDLVFNESLIRSKLVPFDSPSRFRIEDKFFTNSAVLFSIIPHENKPYELVLIHRTDRGSRHRGEMSFPGGKVDPTDKDSIDTALRECKEEIGVPRSAVTILGCFDDFPTMTRYVITPIVGFFDKDQKLVKEEREVQEIIKVPIDFFVNKVSFREQAIDFGDKKFPVFYFNYKANDKKYTIWGATAFMIANFIKTIYDYNLSKLNLMRFTTKEIKPLKNYIEMRTKMLTQNEE